LDFFAAIGTNAGRAVGNSSFPFFPRGKFPRFFEFLRRSANR
jgi:hypothetical protein